MKGVRVLISGKIMLALIIALFIVTSSCGCIKIVQKSLATNQTTGDSPVAVTTILPEITTVPPTVQPDIPEVETTPTPEITQNLTVQVESALPITDRASYETLHATRINETTKFNQSGTRQEREPEFEKTYTMGCNATGLILDVKKGPLVIGFDIQPVHDCTENPGSCRGSLTASVNRPYFTMTVRDNETREIVAQDGYGGEFSSEKDNRSITVYGTGKYHLTLEGCFVRVDLAIITGNSPISGTADKEDYGVDYEEDW